MCDLRSSAKAWLSDLADQMRSARSAGAARAPECLTIREFLSQFGYSKRGHRVVSMIEDELERHGLRTSPDFTSAFIDAEICIELVSPSEPASFHDPALRIGILSAAHSSPTYVHPDAPVSKAITLMLLHDYSQLPVMKSEHKVVGIVSWRSIGESPIPDSCSRVVADCMQDLPVDPVREDKLLIEATELVCEHGFILVKDSQSRISGIVTAADLADEFKERTHPFLLLGEIERHLRNLLHGVFELDELQAVSVGTKEVGGPKDLTMGGYVKLLEDPAKWAKLSWSLDRKEFIKVLKKVNVIRNDVMHFSPEPTGQPDLVPLKQMARLLRFQARERKFKRRTVGDDLPTDSDGAM